jgi:rod shape-determining protein MreC
MSQLIQIFISIRNFILFIILEIICFRLIITSNNYWDVSYFNTSNVAAAKVLAWQKSNADYFNLREVNQDLAAQNKALLEKVSKLEQQSAFSPDLYKADSAFASRYKFITAKAINNSINLVDNYVTIDKGTADGIQPGMGVITSTGVVGRVKACKEHMSLVYSILHSKFQISGKLKNANQIGTVKWDGVNPRYVQLDAVSKFNPVKIGDTLLSSEYNAIFPVNTLVGRVKKVTSNKIEAFHKIEVELLTDFPNLSFVYVVNNIQKKEQDKVEEGLSSQAQIENQ